MQSISELIPKEIQQVDPLKEIKDYCWKRVKEEYKGSMPVGMYWGIRTSHLKTLSDWAYAKAEADQEEKRGKNWFKTFIGNLKVQPWQKKDD